MGNGEGSGVGIGVGIGVGSGARGCPSPMSAEDGFRSAKPLCLIRDR